MVKNIQAGGELFFKVSTDRTENVFVSKPRKTAKNTEQQVETSFDESHIVYVYSCIAYYCSEFDYPTAAITVKVYEKSIIKDRKIGIYTIKIDDLIKKYTKSN
jgi:hypothetical protein